MRAALVLNIIESYFKNESSFMDAVQELVQDESKKGNDDFVNKINDILKNKKNTKKSNIKNSFLQSTGPIFNLSNANTTTLLQPPKDKDSSLSLMEIINPSISFSDLVLSEKMKKTIDQIIEETKKSALLENAGIHPTKRILFYGPPGCGKTVMGLALAKALGKKVAYVRLDSLFSSYLGQTSTNLRKIFDAVKSGEYALFLDEFDSIGKKRDDSQEVGELKRIVITLLQNLDLLPPDILVIAATNHQHLLDPAVWRRFDVAIAVDEPTAEYRQEFINKMLQEYKDCLPWHIQFWYNPWLFYRLRFSRFHDKCQGRDFHVLHNPRLLKFTEGMSTSRLKDLVNQVIKTYLLRDKANKITMEDFINSIFVIEKFDNSKDALINWSFQLSKKGLSLRELENITGIPKSTLSHRFKSMEVK